MTLAFGLNIFIGLLWVAIGTVMSRVAGHGRSIIGFFAIASGMTAGLLWIFWVDWGVIVAGEVDRPLNLIACMCGAGTINAAGQVFMVSTMRRGHQGLTWIIAQSSMIVSFLAAWLVWHESFAPAGWTGILVILAGLAVLATARHRHDDAPYDWRWLCLVALTFLAIGISQTLMAAPSHWPGFADTARLRTSISLTAGTVVHGAVAVFRRLRIDRVTFRLSLYWVALASISYIGLFQCLDLMAAHQLSGIVFPVGIGICVAGFSLYSKLHLREHFAPRTIGGLALILIGVALLAFAR